MIKHKSLVTRKKMGFKAKVILVLSIPIIFINLIKHEASTDGTPFILAHRGFSQSFDVTKVNNNTCTAKIIAPPKHQYIENTIASIQASFEAGVEIVEIDIQPTADNQFVLFHDWSLACRTNGKGVTHKQTLDYLQSLDVGFGYTHDFGKTYPFRGRGMGLMPDLNHVLKIFQNKKLMLNFKKNSASDGRNLARVLQKLPINQQKNIMIYSKGNKAIDAIKEFRLGVKTMSKIGLKKCLQNYMLIGWSGFFPPSCKNTIIIIPINYSKYFWGWPQKIYHQAKQHNSEIILVGPYAGGDHIPGIDSVQDFQKIPADFQGGVWTNVPLKLKNFLSTHNLPTST